MHTLGIIKLTTDTQNQMKNRIIAICHKPAKSNSNDGNWIVRYLEKVNTNFHNEQVIESRKAFWKKKDAIAWCLNPM